MLIRVLVNAVEQMSLELRLESFQRLTVPDLRWHASGADMAKQRRPKSVAVDEVAAYGRSQSASGTDR